MDSQQQPQAHEPGIWVRVEELDRDNKAASTPGALIKPCASSTSAEASPPPTGVPAIAMAKSRP